MIKTAIADLICRKLFLTDTASVTMCKDFIKRRYEMIWNFALWKQSLITQTLSAPADESVVELSSGFEFPVAIRWDEHTISPIDHATVFALNPNAFEQRGTPGRFIDLPRTTAGVCRIQLVEKPEVAASLLILGKAKLTNLENDTDSGVLVALDNCLLAYVERDMLEYDRQYAKATAKLEEANALLKGMRDLESYQAARIQQLIPGSVGTETDLSGFGY